MGKTTVPYHFVPVSKWVHAPTWAAFAGHDMPFKDGISGSLDITITNASPLLIGGNNDSNEVSTYIDINGKPTIPGSSLKGMIRNFLEIATFAKMKRVNDKNFAKRLHNVPSNYQIEAGWLRMIDGKWQFYPCRYAKIKHEWLKNKVSQLKNVKFGDDNNKLYVLKKYEALGLHNSFNFVEKASNNSKDQQPHVDIDQSGKGEKGHVVFSGSMQRVNTEFVFFKPQQKAKSIDKNMELLVEQMLKAHDEEMPEETILLPSGKTAKFKKLKDYYQKVGLGFPVFLATNKRTKECSFGFSKAHRKMSLNSVHKAIDNVSPNHLDEQIYDFTETLFGVIKKDESLFSSKGRVMFTDAPCEQQQPSNKTSGKIIQGEPKASFSQAYTQQGEGYDTSSSKIRGWKRYPAHASVSVDASRLMPDNANSNALNNENVTTILKPVANNSVFKGKVHFHNLKPAELGALLWALNLYTNHNGYHSLGRAKAFGYGKVKIDITNADLNPNLRTAEVASIEEYTEQFEAYMESQYSKAFPNNSWLSSPQIESLLAMTQPVGQQDIELRYMSLPEHKNAGTLTSFRGINEKEPNSPKSGHAFKVLQGEKEMQKEFKHRKDKAELLEKQAKEEKLAAAKLAEEQQGMTETEKKVDDVFKSNDIGNELNKFISDLLEQGDKRLVSETLEAFESLESAKLYFSSGDRKKKKKKDEKLDPLRALVD